MVSSYRDLETQGLALPFNLNISREILDGAETELLAWDIFHIFWVALFSPVLVGASWEERLVLDKLLHHMCLIEPIKVC